MESKPLVLTDPNLLAEFVRESEFRTFFEKRFAVSADIAALLFRDGAFIDAYKGTQFSVGGLWENMKGLLGGSHHYALMLADLKPFQVQFPIAAMSRDHVEIAGVATLELQLNPDKPGNILGLMSGVSRNAPTEDSAGSASAGRKALSRFDVLARIEPQFQDRIFEHVLGRHDAQEVRGNRGMQDQLQADMMTEAQRICGAIGVVVLNTSITFAMNEVEREQFEKARIERQQEMLDYQLGLLKREIGRQSEATEVKLKANVDIAKLQRASEDDLKLMVLGSEVAFVDAREGHARRQEMEALKHEIDVLRAEDFAKAEKTLRDIGNEVDATQERKKLAESRIELDRIEQEYRRENLLIEGKLALELQQLQLEGRHAVHKAGLGETQDFAEQAARNLERMNEIEAKQADANADRDIRVNKANTGLRIDEGDAEARRKVDQMLAAGNLSPEQLAALMPGLSRDAADVAIEKARNDGASADRLLEMARGLMDQSREHEHRMFETGMRGGSGMAAGLGGAAPVVGMVSAPPETVECPNCGKVMNAKARFCSGCQHQLRT